MRPGNLHFSLLALALFSAPLFVGCGLASQLVYVFRGNFIEPKFAGLKEKKTAVVCVSSSTAGPGTEADTLARAVTSILEKRGDTIELVPQDKVIDWVDKNNWNQLDYKQVGKGVKAEMVVAIDLNSFSIHEGSTLLRGKANVSVKVFDLTQKGKLVYDPGPREISFPKNGAGQITQDENSFRRQFIIALASEISRDFHRYDAVEEVARDSAFLGSN